MADPTVHVEIKERGEARIAWVTIDNQRRLNCLATPLILAVTQAFTKLAGDGSLRAVVLTGAGKRAFIGGADLNELGALCTDSARLFITRLHQACATVRACPVPVIGRVNGFCLGGGLGPIDIQDSHWESVLIHCAWDQLIRSAVHGEAIRAQ